MRRCKLLSHAVKVFEVVVRGFIGPFRETSLLEMSKRNSAIASRWSGGRVTMGPAGRDRRVRGFPSKKRQPGRRSESPELDFLDEALLPAASSMAESKDKVPLLVRDYTEPSQRPQGQKRGRNATLSRTSLKSRFSLDGLLTSSPKELAEILIDLGILKDRSTESCACGRSSSKLEAREAHCSWRCTKCRKCVSVLAEDQDLFPGRLPLRTFAGGLWLFCSPLHLSPDKAGLILGVDNRVVRALFEKWRGFLSPLVEAMNNALEIGGLGEDVELDEIAFRSKTVGDNVVWIRFLAIASRGSSFVFLTRLPYRVTQGGQGGGGPISVEELREALTTSSGTCRLKEGTVCHTDSARTYKRLGSSSGSLLDGSYVHDFSASKLAHTCVRHKPPSPEFSKRLEVEVWSGSTWVLESRVGGTQKLDGFFATFRRLVGASAF